jgi:hypothetical protein
MCVHPCARRQRARLRRVSCAAGRRWGLGGLVDTAEFQAVRRELGLSALGDEERSCAVGGYDAETTERVCDEPDVTACTTSGMHALRGGGDVGFEVGEGAELRGDDACERVCAL